MNPNTNIPHDWLSSVMVSSCSFAQLKLLSAADGLIAGGIVILAEEFSHEIYRKSLARLFELDESGHLQMYFNATFDVVASKVTLEPASLVSHDVPVATTSRTTAIPGLGTADIIAEGEQNRQHLNMVYACSWQCITCSQDSSQCFVWHDLVLPRVQLSVHSVSAVGVKMRSGHA